MIWYYADGDQKKGPFSDSELKELLKNRVINPDTLIWRQGLSGWVPLSRFIKKNKPLATKANEPLQMEKTQCSQCRSFFPRDQLVSIDNDLVCASCKPMVLQKVKEGVTRSSVQNDQNSFFHQAAKASWVFPIIAVAVGFFTQNMSKEPNLKTSYLLIVVFEMFIFLLGLCLGLISLFGIKKYGREKILKQAIIGTSINFAIFSLLLLIAISAIIMKSHST